MTRINICRGIKITDNITTSTSTLDNSVGLRNGINVVFIPFDLIPDVCKALNLSRERQYNRDGIMKEVNTNEIIFEDDDINEL